MSIKYSNLDKLPTNDEEVVANFNLMLTACGGLQARTAANLYKIYREVYELSVLDSYEKVLMAIVGEKENYDA